MAKEFHAVVHEIEPLHFLGAAHHVGQHLAEWHDDIEEVERRADGIRQQGTENEVILLVKEDDLRVTDSQAGPEGLGAFNAAKAAANDDDSFLFHRGGGTGLGAGHRAGDDGWETGFYSGGRVPMGLAGKAQRARIAAGSEDVGHGDHTERRPNPDPPAVNWRVPRVSAQGVSPG